MRLAIADPPYLGRSVRWYGGGRGHFRDEGTRADVHPDAAEWDDPARHAFLVAELERDYDGWAIALAADTLGLYLGLCPSSTRVMVWNKGNGMPSGSRLLNNWEPVLVRIPDGRLGRGAGPTVSDVHNGSINPRAGFVGAKPAAWTRWVLAALAYDPGVDTVTDLFPGSGAVSRAVDGMLL